jgi:hypothetical protein
VINKRVSSVKTLLAMSLICVMILGSSLQVFADSTTLGGILELASQSKTTLKTEPDLQSRNNNGDIISGFNNNVDAAAGSVGIDKRVVDFDETTATATIQIDVQGKAILDSGSQPLDVVLLYDVSKSMDKTANGKTRLQHSKDAGNVFTDIILNEEGIKRNNKIAIVSFHTFGRTVSDFSNSASEITNAINALNTDYKEEGGGNTNAPSGLMIARSLLESTRTDSKKIIILLGDGAQNILFAPKRNTESDTSLENYIGYTKNGPMPVSSMATDFKSFPDDYFFNLEYGNSVANNRILSNILALDITLAKKISNATIGLATEIKTANPDWLIYTVGLGLPQEADEDSSNDFEEVYAHKTLRAVASSSKHYFEIDPAVEDLNAIYKSVAGTLMSAGSNAVVTEVLHSMVELVGTPVSDYMTGKQPTVSGKTITWEIGEVPSETPATMRYQIKITPELVGEIPLHDSSKIDYISASTDDSVSQTFPGDSGIFASSIDIEVELTDAANLSKTNRLFTIDINGVNKILDLTDSAFESIRYYVYSTNEGNISEPISMSAKLTENQINAGYNVSYVNANNSSLIKTIENIINTNGHYNNDISGKKMVIGFDGSNKNRSTYPRLTFTMQQYGSPVVTPKPGNNNTNTTEPNNATPYPTAGATYPPLSSGTDNDNEGGMGGMAYAFDDSSNDYDTAPPLGGNASNDDSDTVDIESDDTPFGLGGLSDKDKSNPETRENVTLFIAIVVVQLIAVVGLYITFKNRKRRRASR